MQTGQARRKAVDDLEAQIKVQEELANSPLFKNNLELKISTERALVWSWTN